MINIELRETNNGKQVVASLIVNNLPTQIDAVGMDVMEALELITKEIGEYGFNTTKEIEDYFDKG